MSGRAWVCAAVAIVATLATTQAFAEDETVVKPMFAQSNTVRLHIDSDAKATLEGADASPLCEAPCEIDVPAYGKYRIRIDGEAKPSEPFELKTIPGWSRVTLRVAAPSHGTRSAGAVLAVVGLIGVTAGVVIAEGGANSGGSNGAGLGGVIVGGSVGVMALIPLVVGLVLLATSSSVPSVEQSVKTTSTPLRFVWRESAPTNREVPNLRIAF